MAKWNNLKTNGSVGHNDTYPDTDFFLFRVAEAYLTYAEATARQNGGTATADGIEAIIGAIKVVRKTAATSLPTKISLPFRQTR